MFDEEAIQQMQAMPPCLDLDKPPSEEELEAALSKLKKRKAGGKTGIFHKLVMFRGAVLWIRLLELMQVMWREGEVVADWKNAEVVPIPKKGDLQRCDNWRGILRCIKASPRCVGTSCVTFACVYIIVVKLCKLT